MSTSRERFIERMGSLADLDGAPRITGHLHALLVLTPGEMSMEELAEALRVSKASVSTNARWLESRGVIERTVHVGDRRVYFHIAGDQEFRMMERALRRMRFGRDLFENATQELTEEPPLVRDRLRTLTEMYAGVVARMESHLSRLRAGRADQAAESRPAAR
ncbi:MAG TPA: MarR family transcriptional regulator [Longimicrobiales bacterium]|nr:MarR family transcriptional regulator [Longimicrobiales bacterium]